MRKYNLAHESATARGRSFAGLPPGYSHFDLCDDLDAAGRHLGLSSDAISLLRYLIKRTRHSDWQPGSKPVIGWSRFYICHELQWSEDKLGRVESKLISAEMIAFEDSPNCKRFTHRTEDGSLAPSSRGISLAPLGARASELRALVQEQREDARRLYETFASLFAMRAALMQLQSHPMACAQLLVVMAAQIALLPTRRDPVAALAPLLNLAAETEAVISQLRAALGVDESPYRAPAQHSPRTHIKRGQVGRHHHADSCAAKSWTLLRKSAVHKEPDSKNHTESEIVTELRSAPHGLRTYIEAAAPGSSTMSALDVALIKYARDVNIPPAITWRLQSTYGRLQSLRSIIAVGRQIEAGKHVTNPIGYAYAVARAGLLPMHRNIPQRLDPWACA